MQEQKYLSTDPNEGQPASAAAYLGTDPSDEQAGPSMHAPTDTEAVTLGDLRDNPRAAIERMGASLKRDVSNPNLWLGLAASYFGPKVFGHAIPIVSRAAATATRSAKAIGNIDADLVTIASPRLGGVIRVGQKVATWAQNRAAKGQPTEATATPGPLVKGKSPQQILNEEAIARRRASIQSPSISGGPLSSAPAPLKVPASPTVARPPTAGSELARPSPAPKPKLTGGEQRILIEQLSRGKTYDQAYEAVRVARELAARLKGPTSEEVRKSVRHRNQTGAW